MLTCKRIQDSVSETVYFLLINVHEDKRDLEHGSSFDVEVTDGQSAWMKKGRPFCEQCMVPSTLSKTDAKLLVGIQRPHTQIADWMATAIQALSQESDTFTYIVTKTKSTGLLRVSSHVDESRALIKQENFPAPQVRWEYFRSMQDFEGNLAGQIDLDHQDDAAANVQHLLHTALDNLSSLQVQVTLELRQHRNYAWHSTCGWPAAQTSQSQLQQHCISFQQEASIAQQQVQRYVEQKEQREAELYVKFAAILNEKKAKTLEWKAKAEQAQDTAQRATNKGVADDGTPSRDLGDTYSVSTDPSGDEGDTKAINTYEDNSIAADAIGSQSGHAELMAKGDSGALSSQPSQAPESREGAGAAASGTQETQNDPAEDAAMQEGNYMDVDTVPISEEELPVQTKGSDDVAMKSNAKAQQDTAPQVQPSTTRPARPKAAVRRRR